MASKLLLLTCVLSAVVLLQAGPVFPPDELLVHYGNEDGNIQSRADGDYRLPTTSKPSHYVIKLNPHLTEGNFTFTGETTITLEVVEATNSITIHSKEQTIAESQTTLTNYATNISYAVTHTYDTVRDFLTLTTATTLPVGNYTLTLHYTATLRDDMIGFYKSSYTNSTGATIWIATSKFEPTHARYAFPCYDEPALKATVDIWLKRESWQHSLANTPILTETLDSADGKVWSVFQTTPPTSTYLVAFIASDFAGITTEDETFGVWARSSSISTGQYAFDIGLRALDSLENYTNIDYYSFAMEKMDQIAIPDFASGAMENWGLVTYRERYLLFQDGVSTTADKQNIATVISHEFAHQWFGNLISPEWWRYLWLNEGFATYFEYFTPDELEPEWRLDEQFAVTETQGLAFAVDGLGTSHPMNAEVEIITEIQGIFDSISYAKAGSVIRMLEHIITNPVFRAGLTNYLRTNAFDIGTSDRLWAAVQEVVDTSGQSFNVKEVMDTWVTQAGYPVVTVTRNYEGNTAVLSQERFFLRDANLYDPAVYWWVPINWATASSPDYSVTTATTWIPANTSITITSPSASEWILLNKQQTGFYRVNYDQTNWNLLISYLHSSSYTQISAINRAQLIDDALNLARGGYLDYATALNVTKYLSHETDYIPWYSAFTGFTYINRLLAETDSYSNFKTYLTSLLANVLETVGYDELDTDEHVHKFLRINALTWSCNLDQDDCLKFANERLTSWLVDGSETAITPNLKTPVYCAGIRTANATIWNLLWNKYLATDLSSEQILILRGLGCTSDTEILNRYMALATTDGSGIRFQDSTTAFAAVYTYGGSQNVEPALDYIINNLETIIEYYGGTASVATLLSGIGLRITTTAQLQKLQDFATAQATLLGTSANTAITSAQQNLAWIENNAAEVSTWLAENVDTAGEGSGANAIVSSMMLTLSFVYLLFIYNYKNRMTLTKVVLLVALLVATASASPLIREDLAQISNINRADSEYRLPNNTAPISYDIRLTPYIVVGNFTFDGEAEISLQVLEPTNTITLHTNALTYNEALTTLVSEDGTSQTIISHTYNTALQFLIVEVQNELPVGNYTLSFTFVGLLSLDMYGFYRSSYVNAAGDTVWLATTQFQATAARRAFPCYDEPALKATFNISIKHEPHLHALSNMPIAAQYTDTSDDKVWTTFETTPVMSTYLVAFVVSDYVAIKNADESFNAWSRANAIADSQFIFDIGEVELAELEQYTSVDYTLPKMDQISIPDFSAGAMENWGLVTYRESYFHYNENTSTLATKQDIATVVSHEFAHQWFGNLVGPYWWKYLWLNEGFATYFQYLTTDAVVDNWRLIEQFVIRVQQASAFAYDSSAFSHPMTQDVASPAEINSIFDTISYFKAASVIRMTSHFLTEDVFKAGLTKYLNNKAFGTAVPDDLYDALQEAETEAGVLPFHVYVKNILETWVDQMGYPVVTLTRNYTTGTTEITQERFLLGGTNPADTNEYRWWIPINWATQANPDFSSTAASDWIREQDASIIISGFNVNGWVIFNKQQTGYYRVNYDDTNWGFLSTYLNSDNYANIHVLNRAALIDDAFNLARADRVSYTVVFDLILYLHREVDYIPWFPAYNGLVFVNRLFANTNEYETFRAYLSFLMTDVFETVGIQEAVGDDHTTQLNRVNTINHACSYGLQSCRSSAEARLTAWLDDSAANPISATLLSTTICAGLRGSSPTIWYRALHRYLTTASSTEQTALLAGLGCSEDPDVINAWLDALIEPSTGISIAVAIPAFVSVYQANAYNVDRAFDFIVNNLDRMISYFGSNASIQVFILGISYRMTTPAQLEKLNAFIAAQTEVVGGSATTAIGYVESNIAWNNLHGEEIRTWLRLWAADSEDVSTAQPEPTTQQPTTTTTTTEQAQTTPQEVETTTEEVLTTTEQVQTTTEQVQTTTQQQTTTEQIQTTTEPIQTTTEPIQTTTEQVQTTTEQIQTTTEGSDPAPPEDDSTTVEPDDPVTEESTEGSAATAYLSFFAVIPVFLCMLKVN